MKTKICLYILILSACIACSSKQTKPEILLVGIAHYIPDSLSCNWTDPRNKILNYNPDQIGIEFNAPDDTSSHPSFFGKDYRPIFDSILLAWEGKMINPQDSINKYFLLAQDDTTLAARIPLWKYYLLRMDFGNRDYQTYLLHQSLQKSGQLPDTASEPGRAFWLRYKQTVASRKDGEFFNLVFPIAQQLGIDSLIPTDNKSTYLLQSDAWSQFYEQYNGKPEMHKLDSFWKDYVATEQKHMADCDLLTYLNLPSTLTSTDYGQAHVADDLKNEHYTRYGEVWYRRNKLIANNIAAAMTRSGAKRMAVFYGNIHVFPVKKYLEEQGFKVKLLGELK